MRTGPSKVAADVLRRSVEHAFASGATLSQVMRQLHVGYEYAYLIKHDMQIPVERTGRRCTGQPVRRGKARSA